MVLLSCIALYKGGWPTLNELNGVFLGTPVKNVFKKTSLTQFG